MGKIVVKCQFFLTTTPEAGRQRTRRRHPSTLRSSAQYQKAVKKMEIKFSRHAKRRMKLYNISEVIIQNLLVEADQDNKHEIVRDVPGFKYPIKVVFEKKVNLISVITVYPLKRAYK